MKIRLTFVPNSSSSSFIVAFPKKPKDVIDVLRFMFGKDVTGNVCGDCDDGFISKMDVASTVWKDINRKENNKISIGQIAEEMHGRYYYAHGNIFPNGWHGKDRWYGVDNKLLDQLKDLYIKEDNDRREEYKKEKEILKKSGLVMPEWKNNETEKDKKQREQYHKDLTAWKESSGVWKKWRKNSFKEHMTLYNKINKLKEKIAKIDAKKFVEDNKKCFLAIFEYSDKDGNYGSIMEHSNIFSNLPHVTVNKH